MIYKVSKLIWTCFVNLLLSIDLIWCLTLISVSLSLSTFSAYDYTIGPHEKELVKTDLAIKVPEGSYGRIAPRSGLAVKNFIDVGAGVVDRDYRGNVGVVLFNFGKEAFEIKKGDKIAQLILERIIETEECEELDSLDETERGEGKQSVFD